MTTETDDPATQRIGRPRRRNGVEGDPQTAFNDEIVDVESESGAALLDQVKVREANLAAHRIYVAADADVKKYCAPYKLDKQAHTLLLPGFAVHVTPNEKTEDVVISFSRTPSARVTIRTREN
jgi:hypothetical protein